MNTQRFLWLCACILLATFSGCKFYTQDIIFRVDNEASKQYLKQEVTNLRENYKYRVNDIVDFNVYTNNGELLVDPNRELSRQLMGGMQGMMQGGLTTVRDPYLILPNGNVFFPMVGYVHLKDLTVRQADSVLAEKFNVFYKDCMVRTKILNRRCFIFIPTQGGFANTSGVSGRVLILENENTTIIEALALAGSLPSYSPLDRVRLIRGDLTNPEVHVINLQYIDKMVKGQIFVRPNDIIYLEPGRRPALDGLRDVSAILTTFIGLATLYFVILNTTR